MTEGNLVQLKKKILFFCKESSQAFGLIKPPFQWKQGALPPG
jgi:hypothetical protein